MIIIRSGRIMTSDTIFVKFVTNVVTLGYIQTLVFKNIQTHIGNHLFDWLKIFCTEKYL